MTALDLEGALARILSDEEYAAMFSPEGLARQAQWEAADGWIVGYTTGRIRHGKHDGLFATFAMKPEGKGARGGRGKARSWRRVYWRTFSTRKSARRRAEALYEKHNERRPGH